MNIAEIASVSTSFSFADSAAYFPYVALLLGATISLWFHRGHAFLALVSLLIAYAGYHFTVYSSASEFATRAVFAAAAIFVPFNILLVLLSPERGVFHYRSYRWLLILVVETLLTAWIASAGHSPVSGTAWHALLDHWFLRPAPTPFAGRLLLAAAVSVAIAKSWERQPPMEVAMAGALIAFFFACQWPASAGIFAAFMSAAGIILLMAVLQESHRMAFRDDLTGLFGRRALEEQLLALGPVYAIAMVDVDHFKKFNDTHGHEIGDQVLKLVGAQMAQIGGGGKAFRYGGEEFSVLFPDHRAEDALPYLEELRERI
ncbi:MAG: GGDEF domain-containing protein, partial [Burkholderiales bacterium]